MARRYLPVKAAALAAAGFLLIGGGPAVAAPDSSSGKGGGTPSSAASGKSSGKSGNGQGNSGSNPGNSGSNPGNSGSNPGKPAAMPGGAPPGQAKSGPKGLPDAASAVAGTATAKTNPASSGAPNSFGKSVAAAASGQHAQGAGVDAEIPGTTSVPTATAAPVTPATDTVPLEAAATVTPSAAGSGSASELDSNPTPRTDRSGAAPAVPAAPAPQAGPSANAAPEVGPQQRPASSPSAAAPASAALSLTPPQSTADAPGSTPTGAQSSWLGRVAGQVADEVRAALREVSLKELALAALPGLAGIVFCLATGIGLGHRQAKFGFALESTGALRFAVRGPIGVLRPGGFISLPNRAGTPRSTRSRVALDDRAA